jgi:murein DD-endopeptidase MepM/ murein hydrolase activator NlpD
MGELRLRLPLDGNPDVSSPYGTRFHPKKDRLMVKVNDKKMRNPFASPLKFHGGIDYAVNVGKDVKASERGRVIRA